MEKRVIARSPVRAVTLSPDVYEESLLTGNYEPIVENFRMIARDCIEDGSELIIAGCGALAPILTKQELFSIEHVPVINPSLVTIKTAEASVDLFQKAHIPAVSRHGPFRLIPKAFHERLSEMF